MYHAGRLDVALVKREPSAAVDGQRVWSEPLVWVGANDGVFETGGVTALVVSPEPCVYRKRAVEALGKAGGRARAAYVCGSLAGALAAVRAGLGLAVLPRDFAPDDLAIDEGQRMPPLADAEAVLLTAADAGLAARRLADHLAHALEDEPARF
jgi:DNA-binding transcriptional LysR family regulator